MENIEKQNNSPTLSRSFENLVLQKIISRVKPFSEHFADSEDIASESTIESEEAEEYPNEW